MGTPQRQDQAATITCRQQLLQVGDPSVADDASVRIQTSKPDHPDYLEQLQSLRAVVVLVIVMTK